MVNYRMGFQRLSARTSYRLRCPVPPPHNRERTLKVCSYNENKNVATTESQR